MELPHLLDPYYDHNHRGWRTAEGEVRIVITFSIPFILYLCFFNVLSLCAGAAPPSCSNPWRVAGDAVRWEVHSSAEEGKPWRRIVSGSPRVTSLQPCSDYSFGWQVHSLCNTECHLLRYLRMLRRDTLIICHLLCRWRPETHTFHLPCDEMAVTLQDV